MQTAIVLFSGGQDSTTCLFYALKHFEQVLTIGFAYGQRHNIEMTCRKSILEQIGNFFPPLAQRLGRDLVVPIPSLQDLAPNALLLEQPILADCASGLPNTFVPARNLLFLGYAGALAYQVQAQTLILGVSQVDYSNYPDCRETTVKAMQRALTLGLDRAIHIETPLMFLSKADTWRLAEQIAGKQLVDFIVEYTHSCYEGIRTIRHKWGYGCGHCPACLLRKRGYEKYLADNFLTA